MTDITDSRDIGGVPSAEAHIDVSDKIEHDRYQAINEARKQVQKVRLNSQVAMAGGKLTRIQSAAILRNALETYLLELRPYAGVDDKARGFWHGFDDRGLGTVEIRAPGPGWHGDEGTVAHLAGLEDVLTAPAVYEREFWKPVKARHGPDTTRRETVYRSIPRPVLKDAISWANSFSRHIGLDIDPGPTDDEWEI